MPLDDWEVELIGYIGGFVLSISLMPQLLVTFQTKSTKEISYLWMTLYILGLILTLIYYVLLNATAGWVTVSIEVLGGVLLLLMKIWYENGYKAPVQTPSIPEPFNSVIIPSQENPPVLKKNKSVESITYNMRLGSASAVGLKKANSQVSLNIETGKSKDPSFRKMKSQSEISNDEQVAPTTLKDFLLPFNSQNQATHPIPHSSSSTSSHFNTLKLYSKSLGDITDTVSKAPIRKEQHFYSNKEVSSQTNQSQPSKPVMDNAPKLEIPAKSTTTQPNFLSKSKSSPLRKPLSLPDTKEASEDSD